MLLCVITILLLADIVIVCDKNNWRNKHSKEDRPCGTTVEQAVVVETRATHTDELTATLEGMMTSNLMPC